MKFLVFLFFTFNMVFALSLEQAVELAVKNNTSARLSLLDLQKAEENIRKARAGILPKVSFSYSYTRLGGDLAFGFTPKNRHSYVLEMDQTLFNRGVFEGLSLAREQKELQELVYEDIKREVEFQTKQLFYALLYKREVVKLLEENLKYWEENYKQTEGKFQAGVIPKVELMRAKAQLENAKAQLENTLADYRKSLEDFKAFLRYDGEIEVEGKLEMQELKQGDFKALLENNSTLKVARRSLEVSKRVVELQKSQYYPTLDLFATYQGNTARIGGKDSMLNGYTIGARLNYNIFDGFAREASIAQARIDLLKQMENLKDTEQKLRAELNKTLLDIDSLRAQIGAVKLSLESAEESLRLSKERYRFGVATQLEVLDAVSNYNNTLQNYYFLLYLYNTALARLERLTK
ncbi:TolC family protein [Pampinifervens florentissimum]|uniref:TolC family protein n=1 Tax=Pampinifervens florentissimum TaxID=1632019 RepID=UPI0013B47CAB|nr:TolC family protein [Hydrogenobacter sp. T-8]QID32769.1 TolC family protein [Hydrogenobacter sp. T-8]